RRSGSTPTAPTPAAGSAPGLGPTRSSTMRGPASARSTRTRWSGVPGMRRADDLHAAVPRRRRHEPCGLADAVPARLDAAASGQPPALRDAHDPLADANIATDVEDVVA